MGFQVESSRESAEMPEEVRKDTRRAWHDQNSSRNIAEESQDQSKGSRDLQERYLVHGLGKRAEMRGFRAWLP